MLLGAKDDSREDKKGAKEVNIFLKTAIWVYFQRDARRQSSTSKFGDFEAR